MWSGHIRRANRCSPRVRGLKCGQDCCRRYLLTRAAFRSHRFRLRIELDFVGSGIDLGCDATSILLASIAWALSKRRLTTAQLSADANSATKRCNPQLLDIPLLFIILRVKPRRSGRGGRARTAEPSLLCGLPAHVHFVHD